jgi:hypothetical protein
MRICQNHVTLLVQDGEADDLDLALVKRNESVTDEEEVTLFPSVAIFLACFTVMFFICTLMPMNRALVDQPPLLLAHALDATSGTGAKCEAANRSSSK